MKNGIVKLITAALLLTLGPLAANAEPVPFNNHLYEVVVYGPSDDKSWTLARDAAELMTVGEESGHLATITSDEEDAFIHGLVTSEHWVGGSQDISSCDLDEGDPPAEPGCGWKWVNGEGDISTPDFPIVGEYENWLGSEPNDLGAGSGNEDHLAVHLSATRGWNDEGNLGNIVGYVVEWDTVEFTPDECADGCQSSPGQTIDLPDTVVGDGTLSFTTVTVTDDGPCGVFGGHRFFDIPGIGLNDDGYDQDLALKWYMCGDPEFVVVISEFDDVEVPFGTVEVRNDPDAAGVTFFGCDNPLFPGNPVEQDLAITQSIDRFDEVSDGAEEITYDCGTSRGRYKGGTLLPIGVYFDFGTGDYSGDPDGAEEALITLTREKLERVLVAIENARAAGAIKNGDRTKMLQQIKNAIKQLDRGNFAKALSKVEKYLKFVDAAKYKDVGFNYNGLHSRMGDNLKYMFEVKVIPYAP